MLLNEPAVCAVIVTYNRKEYLCKAIAALFEQTYVLSGILIFDNMSIDGTPELLAEKNWIEHTEPGILHDKLIDGKPVFYYRNTENSGGSGGFHDAIGMASQMGYDYLWVMDDDVLPEPDCLKQLMRFSSEEARICIPNRTDDKNVDRAITAMDMKNPFKYSIGMRKTYCPSDCLQEDYVCVCDMPFEGPLIAVSLIKEIGLPKKDLFIIFDDTEYAQRATKKTEIRFVKSAILHRQIVQEKARDRLMGWKEYYGYRNQIWFDSVYGENVAVRKLRPILQVLDLYARAVVRRKWSNIKVISRAYHDGVRGILGKTVVPGYEFK